MHEAVNDFLESAHVVSRSAVSVQDVYFLFLLNDSLKVGILYVQLPPLPAHH